MEVLAAAKVPQYLDRAYSICLYLSADDNLGRRFYCKVRKLRTSPALPDVYTPCHAGHFYSHYFGFDRRPAPALCTICAGEMLPFLLNYVVHSPTARRIPKKIATKRNVSGSNNANKKTASGSRRRKEIQEGLSQGKESGRSHDDIARY